MGGLYSPHNDNGALMADVSNIVDYYANLLIIQYHDRPKAQATIRLVTDLLLCDGIFQDIMDAYNIDTAVGHQLDILGKYIGTDRFFQGNDLIDFFSVITYAESALNEDTNPIFDFRWGFVDYADFDNPAYEKNGVLNYHSILTKGYELNDTDYRTLLKFKIIKNYSNGSHKSIDDALFKFFGTDVVMEQTDTMEITYTVPTQLSAVMLAAISKDVLPRPMGVKLLLTEAV